MEIPVEKQEVIKTSVRVLNVEDNPADAELTLRELKKAGFEIQADVVQTREEFEEKLRAQPYDILLSDYRLPGWSGMDALEILQKQGKEIPFILLSGTVGEETAVESIKKGATDYVLKDRLSRLPHVVDRALKEKAQKDERKRAEEALRVSEERFRALIENSSDAISLLASDGTICFASASTTRILGYSIEEFVGHNAFEHVHPEDVEHMKEIFSRLLQTPDAVVAARYRYRHKDGAWLWIEGIGKNLLADERVQAIVVNFRDITERRRAEEAVRESELRLNSIMDSSPTIIFIKDHQGRYLYVNHQFQQQIPNLRREQIIGKTAEELFPSEQAEAFSANDLQVLQSGRPLQFEEVALNADGLHTGLVTKFPLRDLAGNIYAVCGIVTDITERQRAEEELHQSEEQFRLISENVADLIVVVDLAGRRVYNSPSYKEILGDPEELRGTDSFNEIHPDDRDNVKRIFEETVRTGVGQRAAYRFLLSDGSIRFIESQGSIIRDREGKSSNVLVVSRDVTERKKLEQQFLQSQKMEAIGQLAGGVAHDFNNLLTVISGFGELALDSLAPDSPSRDHLEEVLRASGRAASLTRQLLAFSRRQTLQPKVLNLNEVVVNVDKMLRRLIGENIELAAVLAPDLGRVKADPGQVEQIIMNLVVNARDAMPQGGKLSIETANVELDATYSREHPEARPGPHAMLSVTDTGSGMDKEIRARIFEPFFTTKEKGRGTGLGLSTVYGIVKQSDGNIFVYSEPGLGTTFKVYFPQVQEAAAVVKSSGAAPRSLKGTETILVVEDEEPIRALVRAVLESRGYKLLIATRGEEALALSEGHQGPINIMLTDLVMPGMSGHELAERLAPKRPEMKTLYMSGYTDDTVVRNGLLESSVAFIQKPFTPDALAHKVREVLDASERPK